ncbi:MAG: hypothetical protein ACK5L7_05085 [Paludibacteraceae bacterium]
MKVFFIIFFLILVSCSQTKKTKTAEKSIEEKNNTISNDKYPTLSKHHKVSREEMLFEIEGIYYMEENELNCGITLMLFRENEKLRYKLKTNTRELTNDAKIELNDKKDGYYLTLKNIEWSENEGALDEEGEQVDDSVELPKEIQGVLYKNEITIQNTGNSMNYYVKIAECDQKYIHLIKK